MAVRLDDPIEMQDDDGRKWFLSFLPRRGTPVKMPMAPECRCGTREYPRFDPKCVWHKSLAQQE